MPEYLIPIIEQQVSRRAGWRRVTADTLEAAITEAFDNPDDNATDWGDWEGAESEVIFDEALEPRLAPTLVHGIRADLADIHGMLGDWVEYLRISYRLSLGRQAGLDDLGIYYATDGANYVPLRDDALLPVPEGDAATLASRLLDAIQNDCITLNDACAIQSAFTSASEKALHDYLTGRY